jgi:hypothetical protein
LRALVGWPFESAGNEATVGEAAGGLTALGLLLGIVAITYSWPRRTKIESRRIVATSTFLAGLAFVAELLAFGPRWFPYRWATKVVPFFSGMRVPGRFNMLASLSLAILAGIGATALFSGFARRGVAAAAVAMTVIVGLVLFEVFRRPNPDGMAWWIVSLLILVAVWRLLERGERLRVATGIMVAWMLIEVFIVWNTSGFGNPRRSPSLEASRATWIKNVIGNDRVISITFDNLANPDYLVSSLRPNTNLYAGIRSLDGYDGGLQVRTRWVEAMKSMTNNSTFDTNLTLRSQIKQPLDAKMLARFGVAWVIAEGASPGENPALPGWGPPVKTLATVGLYKNPIFSAEVREYMRTEDLGGRSTAAALNAVRNDAAIVESKSARVTCTDRCEVLPIKAVLRSPGEINVSLPGKAGFLAVPEQYGKGWSLSIDGSPRKVEVSDGWALGAVVRPTDKRAVFSYVQPGIRESALVSALTALFACIGALFRSRSLPKLRFRKRRPIHKPTQEDDVSVEAVQGDRTLAEPVIT